MTLRARLTLSLVATLTASVAACTTPHEGPMMAEPRSSVSLPGVDAGDGGGPDAATTADAADEGGGLDKRALVPALRCSPDAPFTGVTSVFGVPVVAGATLRADERELFYVDPATHEVMGTSRAEATDAFGPASIVDGLAGDVEPGLGLSADGLTLYFGRVTAMPPGPERGMLYKAHRSSLAAPFGVPTAIGVEYPSGRALHPSPTLAEDALFFTRIVGASPRVVRAPLPGATAATATLVTEASGMWWGEAPSLDEEVLYVGAVPPLGPGGPDTSATKIFVAKRTGPGAYGTPTPIVEDGDAPVNVDGQPHLPTWLSPDRCRLYFTRSGVLHVASKMP